MLAPVADPFPVVQDTRDAAAINAVINHETVRPFVGVPDGGTLDITPLLFNPRNLFPFGEHGGFALLWTAPHTLEVHTFILPEGRGVWARQAAYDGIEIARRAGAKCLWTKIPPDAANVKAYAAGMGMEPTGESVQEAGVSYTIYAMELAPCL